MNLSFSKELGVLAKIAEIKRIHAAMEVLLPDSKSTCLLVTSSMPREGKTLCAAGVAAVAAHQNDGRILLIDFNWHAPALHKLFGLELTFDISSFRSENAAAPLVQPSGIKGLDILTAPRSSSDDLDMVFQLPALGREIIRQTRGSYKMIVMDMPSLFPVNHSMMDPVIISKEADGIALVVLANVTPRHQVKRACMVLEGSRSKILGVVVNKWKSPDV